MATVLITGGTGMIGKALTTELLLKGHQVIILTRGEEKHAKTEQPGLKYAQWDTTKGTIEEGVIEKADTIIHLAGANISGKRWTRKRKQEIFDSRIETANLLVKYLQSSKHRVNTFITASAIGWYGTDSQIPNPRPFTEEMPAGKDFLAQTCFAWEKAAYAVSEKGIRVVSIRTGVVLSKEGGALEEFRKPLRFGFATVLGNGKQILSWIHLDDLVRIYIKAVEDPLMTGPYNAVAPSPVSNRTLVTTLAQTIRGKNYMSVHVPDFVLKLVLGELSVEVLKSSTVSADKIKSLGFIFQNPSIEAATLSLRPTKNS